MVRLRQAVWSGLIGGALGGLVTAQCFALFAAAGSFGIAPWRFGALVIACGAAGAWLANSWLRSRVRPFGLAETIGATAGVWLALLLLSPLVNPVARMERFVIDFIAFALLAGLASGALLGAVAGALFGLLSVEVAEMLRPWLWLLGAGIALALLSGSLLTEANGVVAGLAPVAIPGGALAGWLAQREYVRVGLAVDRAGRNAGVEQVQQ